MKKIVIMLTLAVISFGAYAQTTKGDSSFGVIIGGAFDATDHATLGLDYRYNLTNEVRLAPSITHFVKNDLVSGWAIDVNANYVFVLSEYFGFYPLGGLDLSFWKWSFGGLSDNETRLGANIGLGAELYASKDISVGFEVKYLIAKDISQPMIGLRVGYNF